MQRAQAIIEIIKALAWPTVVLLIAYWFRDDIRNKIPGIKKAGPTGVEFDVQKQIIGAQRWSGELKELPGFSRTPFMARVEKSIHESLALIVDHDRIDLLVRHLAQSRLETVFERAYGAIFGSQITALRELSSAGDTGMPIVEFEKLYEAMKAANVIPTEITYETWANYLKAFDFKTESDGRIAITELGKDFLVWMAAVGKSDIRMH